MLVKGGPAQLPEGVCDTQSDPYGSEEGPDVSSLSEDEDRAPLARSRSGECVYGTRMSGVNITVPDDIAVRAREAGLNVSRVATNALLDELDRRAKAEALDAYLAQLEAELGPIGPAEALAASTWADSILETAPKRRGKRGA